MIKKILLWALVAYLVFYVISAPTAAAAALHNLGGLVAQAANALSAFGTAVSS